MFAFREDRNQAVSNWADGDLHSMAAAWLLIQHEHWLPMLDEHGYLDTWEHGGKQYAAPKLVAALDDLEVGSHRLYASGSEHRILALAASLSAGHKVNLSWALEQLDKSNARLVMEAIGRATRLIPVVGG